MTGQTLQHFHLSLKPFGTNSRLCLELLASQPFSVFLNKSLSNMFAFSMPQRRNTENRSGRESSRLEQELKKDLIVKREFCPAILLFLTLYLAVGSEVLPLTLSYVIASLLLSLESLLGYLHITAKFTLTTSYVVSSLRRVPEFEAPIHMSRPRNPSPHPPPPYIQGPCVILEDETDESLSS